MIESDNDDCTPNKIIVCITSILLYCVLLHKCMCIGYILPQLNRISLCWPSIFGSSNTVEEGLLVVAFSDSCFARLLRFVYTQPPMMKHTIVVSTSVTDEESMPVINTSLIPVENI